MPEKVLLGEIVGVHGIRGDVVIRTYTADPAGIAEYGPLIDGAGHPRVIKSLRVTPKGVVARLEGIADRTAAEKLRGVELYVDRARLPEPEDDEFYREDLIGLAAVSPDGQRIGEVVSVQNFGAGDLLEIRTPGSRPTDFVPFTKASVPAVDLAARLVTVVLPVYAPEEPAERHDAGDPQAGGDEPD